MHSLYGTKSRSVCHEQNNDKKSNTLLTQWNWLVMPHNIALAHLRHTLWKIANVLYTLAAEKKNPQSRICWAWFEELYFNQCWYGQEFNLIIFHQALLKSVANLQCSSPKVICLYELYFFDYTYCMHAHMDQLSYLPL